uniref:RING-type E3 ubiquitin transferase n=1 Tax=Leersia perrieri TaxID=77586 RepID=A0A0D9XU32_9ORYZ
MPPEPEKPLPKPKPKPPKPKPPKPKPKPNPESKSSAWTPPERDQMGPPDPLSCAADCSPDCLLYKLCPPPPRPPPPAAAAVHLKSSRLPTPLIALSASLLAVSVVLLLALLISRLLRRRRRRRGRNAPPVLTEQLQHHDEEAAPAAAEFGEEDDGGGGGGGMHHIWYIRTVGLDERAIAAITAMVYDAKKSGVAGGGGCAVCLAEFRDGETLRLLPRCRHAFHRGCIDTWLRAHVNCPLCRAPVIVAGGDKSSSAAAADENADADTAVAATNTRAASDTEIEGREEEQGSPERGVRRAASMVTLPRRPWPEVTLRSPASNSGRMGEMGLAKIARLMKFSEVLEMAGIGIGDRSVSFGRGRSGQSAAAGNNADEISR